KNQQAFIARDQSPSAQQWIDFLKSQTGPAVIHIEQEIGTGFDEYCDLSKDRSGQFAKAGGMGGKPSNKGYFICKHREAERVQAFPVRFFESEKTVRENLGRSAWELLDRRLWRSGELLHLRSRATTNPQKKIQKPKEIPIGY